MGEEVFKNCYFCHSDLKLEISETVVHGYPKYSFVVKRVPQLACTKCNHSFQAEPFQYEKTSIFMKFLESISLKQAEIEYEDMIRYVDNQLHFIGNN